jgi:DEAD/DEAH box helicase domain-containing protein
LDYETSRYLGEKDNFDKFDIKMLCVLEDRPNYRNDEEYERDWNGFLTFANIMQFLPGFYPLTRQGFDIAGFYDGFAEQFYQAQQQDNVEKHSSPWDSVYDLLLDEATINIAKVLAEHNVAVPEIGYEIVNDKNTVVAETEMAWEQLHIALILKPEEKLAAENEGWKVYTIDNILECDAFKEADK